MFFLFFAVVLSFGFDVKITKVDGRIVYYDEIIPKGISGIVICPYEKEKIICARAISYGDFAKLYAYSELKNNAFALPLVYPKAGDKIIFAKDYNRIMIIAPNQIDYLKVKAKYSKNVIISPDVFIAFVEDDLTKDEFVNFARKMNIGRYVFVLNDGIYEVDAISFYVIRKLPYKGSSYHKALFTYANFNLEPINYKVFFRGIK